jgi:hypothetical protein
MRNLFAWLSTLILLVAMGAERARATEKIDFGRYYALVIGINDYAHLPKLESAVNDASAVHDLLRRQYGFESTLLLNPTRYELVSALNKLRAELEPDGNALVFYAGHGYLDEQTRQGYWLPADAEDDNSANWVSNATITDTIKGMAAMHVLVIADSCYSGTLARSAPVVLKTGPERLAELRRIATKPSRKVLTSGGLEPVYDGGGDGHSIFTRAFLQRLRDNDDVIDGYRLFTELRPAVIKNSEQTPTYADIRLAGDEDGDFLFVPVKLGSPARGQEPIGSESVFWQSIQKSDDPEDFRAYLEQYPEGTFSALAHNKLRRLDGSSDRSDVTGEWSTGAIDPSSSKIAYTFSFKVLGERLVGTVTKTGWGKDWRKGILDGKVLGDSITFRTVHTYYELKTVHVPNLAPQVESVRHEYSVFYVGKLIENELHVVVQSEQGGTPDEHMAQRVTESQKQ